MSILLGSFLGQTQQLSSAGNAFLLCVSKNKALTLEIIPIFLLGRETAEAAFIPGQ